MAILSTTLALFTAFGISEAARTVSAETKQQSGATLFLPESYEQYLPLSEPTDVSVSDGYIAVADKKTVYVYNRSEGTYSAYEHGVNVNELYVSGNDLYFLDQGMNLFKTSASRLPSEQLLNAEAIQHCISFAISSDVMYFTKKSGGKAQIYSAPLSAPLSETQRSAEFSAETDPAIAVDDGELYYTHEGVNSHLYRLGSETSFEVLLPQKTISSIAVTGDILYYTASGSFYAYNVTALRQNESGLLFSATGDYSALCAAEDGYIYAVDGKTVKRYDPEQGGFTSYEISSSSSSLGRLDGANDLALAGDHLVVNDKGNSRISVTHVTTKQTSVIPSIQGDYLATDGKRALVANATAAALYDLETKTELETYSSFPTDIVGVASVYGAYYIATQSGFAKIGEDLTLSPVTPSNKTPKLLCSDVYGKLYVAYADGSVYAYSETELMSTQTQGSPSEKIATIQSDVKKISVDLNGTLYALRETEVTTYTKGSEQKYLLNKSLVYSQNDLTSVPSFAFDCTENKTYVLYAGNFLVQTDEWNLPTFQTVTVGEADEKVFAASDATFSLVKIPQRTLYILFDIGKLNGATHFPYLSHELEETEQTALKLGETDTFHIVAVFEKESKTYKTALVQKSACNEEILEQDFLKPAEAFPNCKTGYTTNALPLYKYPYLTDLLTVTNVPKNAEITVLGQIDELDYKYYLVEYEDAEGRVLKGYLPQAYVSAFDGTPPTPEQTVFGETTSDLDSLWRAAFIVLGLAAIGILVDFLILRNKKKD